MSRIFHAKHKEWGVEGYFASGEDAANRMGCNIGDLEFTEMEKTDYLLKAVPEEFRSRLAYMAYERGHSAGESEVELILEGLVSDLLPCIAAFESRIRKETR